MSVTQQELRRRLKYDRKSGLFTWRNNGRAAGCKDSYGYTIIKLGKKTYKAHRLAFLYVTGSMPEADVDRIDMDRGNNRWSNLRSVSRLHNNVNIKSAKGSSSRFLGVHFMSSRNCWTSRIRLRSGRKFLGYFADEVEAAKAYHFAAKAEYGDHARGNPEAFH